MLPTAKPPAPHHMGQVLSTVDRCFQPAHLLAQDEAASIPQPFQQSKQAQVTSNPAPKAPTTAPSAAPAPKAPIPAPAPVAPKEAPVPAAPVPETTPQAPAATVASAETASDEVQPYTNRPENLEGFAQAQSQVDLKTWALGEIPQVIAPLTGNYVTDGKVSFDAAALQYPYVFATREAEVAQLQKAIDMKKDAGAATAQANALHEEHNKLYEAGDKDGARGKLAESKQFREKAKDIHQQSFDIAYSVAIGQAIKACYSKYPSIDYHVYLVDPYEKSYLVAIAIFKTFTKFPRKDFLVIPGEGQHSGASGPAIRPHFEKWMADNKIRNEQITSGSYAIQLDDVKV